MTVAPVRARRPGDDPPADVILQGGDELVVLASQPQLVMVELRAAQMKRIGNEKRNYHATCRRHRWNEDESGHRSGGGVGKTVAEATFPSGRYPSLESIVQKFLNQTGIEVRRAALWGGWLVVGGRATITNLLGDG